MFDRFRVEVPIEIRTIERSDLEQFREWYGSDEHAAESFRRHEKGEVVYLIAHSEGQMVGHLGVDVSGGTVGVMWQFGVAAALRGRGVGSALMRIGESILRDRGFSTAEVEVVVDNIEAKRLYERLGYAVVGRGRDQWSYTDRSGHRVHVDDETFVLRKELS